MPVRSESKAENRQRLMEIVEVVRRHEIVKEGMTPKKLCDIIEELGPTFHQARSDFVDAVGYPAQRIL